ncbi:MAG: hypothetical protein HKO77_05410 [Gemmatimonadetes bacterium]|nr:hypothetical protein [Gemmatimonadota bacterium]
MSSRSGRRRWGVGPTWIKKGLRLSGLAVAVAALVGVHPGSAVAQAPDEDWRTLETAHFRVTFPAELEALGREAADRAERAYDELEQHFIEPPDDRIDLLLTDHADVSNGFAAVTPSNRITIFARPPTEALSLGFADEWLELVITHELAHIIHLDHVVNPIGRLGRAFFGRVPAEWPFFPELGTPRWVIEGIATWYESRLTQAGRARGSFLEMQLRTAALEGRFESIGQAAGESPVWPSGNRPYLYGTMFFDYLLDKHGEDRMSAFVDAVGGQWIPYRLDAAGRSAFGASLTEEWKVWEAEVEAGLADFERALRRLGPITEPEALTEGARWALYPEVSPDGRWLAYARADGISDVEVQVIDLESGEARSLGRTNQLATLAWIDSESLLVSQLELDDPYRLYKDLYVFDLSGEQRRLTEGARLNQPAVSADGSFAVAVREGNGTNELVTYGLATGETRVLVGARPDVHWAFPRISPDGRWISASRFEPDARHDVVVLDASTGAIVQRVTDDRALDLGPRWSADGQWLVWASDRTGVFNAYAAPVDSDGAVGDAVLVTNVRTGVAYPVVDPAGEWLYLSGYHVDGWEIERVPFRPEEGAVRPPLASRFLADGPGTVRAPEEGEVRDYSAGSTLRPWYWEISYDDEIRTPAAVVNVGGTDVALPGRQLLGPSVGIQTEGRDLVGRHAYTLFARVATQGPTKLSGGLSYAYAGLGNPILTLSATQRFEDGGQLVATRQSDATLDTLYVLRQERFLQGGVTLRAPTWRWDRSVTFSGGMVWENRDLLGGNLEPTNEFQLLRPSARLLDGTISLRLNSTRSHSFQMGTSRGLGLFVQGRVRQEVTIPDSLRSVAGSDRSTVQALGSVRGAVPLWRAGHARQVLAFRASGGVSGGPGADPGNFRVGGATGRPEPVTGLELFGGTSFFFPVRGYEPSSRFGRYAWSASAEYRLPLWMIHAGFRAWPIHLDRMMASVFFDVGNAWGPDVWVTGFQNPLRTAIASSGAEVTAEMVTFYDIQLRVRGGVAFPLVTATVPAGEPRFYLRVGLPF